MVDAPHLAWQSWLRAAAEKGSLPPLEQLRVADVGCGTGTLTLALADMCKEVVGIDASEHMLSEAALRAHSGRAMVRWLCQDMRELRLPFAADLILSTCDSLNYLLSDDDWTSTLTKMHGQLRPGGWLCFDVLGPARLEVLRRGVWHDIGDDAVVLFETDVDSAGHIRYDVHAFQQQSDSRLYRRIEEQHEQRYVDEERVRSFLNTAGFTQVKCIGDFGVTDAAAADRLVFAARRD